MRRTMMRTTISLWICSFISLVVLSLVTPLSGQFAYVTNTSSGDVSGFTINATNGALTPIPGSPFAAGLFPASVAVDPTGKFVYVVNTGDNNVSGYTINAANGALTPIPGSPFAAAVGPSFVALDPTGKFAYVANSGSTANGRGPVSGYTINATNGALTPIPGSPFVAGGFPDSLAVDPTGKFVYVSNSGTAENEFLGGVSGYSINASSGALTAIPGSPFAAGTVPTFAAVDPTGRFAYVVNSGAAGNLVPDVSGYTINATSGALTPIPGSPFATESFPLSMAVHPTGKFAYVVNNASFSVSGYTITATNGALTPIPGSPFAAGVSPIFVAVDPAGKFAYVTDIGTNAVLGYTINATSGALTPITGSPFAAGDFPSSLATTPLLIGPPTNTKQCKNGGWRGFAIPRQFKSQGD
jgi:6-phosphogluconolactonase